MSTTDSLTINRLLTEAAERQVSDLHFTVGANPAARRDGKLETLNAEPPVTEEFMKGLVEFFIPENKRARFASAQTLTLTYNFGTRARFRVHGSYQKGYPALDLHYVPWQAPDVTTMGLPKILLNSIKEKEGLILLSGLQGSGRSATLAALLDNINHTQAKHIVTIEDPVEYLLTNDKSFIKQKDVGDDIPSVEDALGGLKDEDVDVLAIDVPLNMAAWREIFTRARSGTLVFVAMEADTSVRALESLILSWPGAEADSLKQLLSETLLIATSQRLVPRVGGGKVMVVECLLGNTPVKSLIRDGKILQLQNVLELSREDGMVSLEKRLSDLVKTGEITQEDAVAHAVNKEVIGSMLRVK